MPKYNWKWKYVDGFVQDCIGGTALNHRCVCVSSNKLSTVRVNWLWKFVPFTKEIAIICSHDFSLIPSPEWRHLMRVMETMMTSIWRMKNIMTTWRSGPSRKKMFRSHHGMVKTFYKWYWKRKTDVRCELTRCCTWYELFFCLRDVRHRWTKSATTLGHMWIFTSIFHHEDVI